MAKGRKTGGRSFTSEYQPAIKGRKALPEDLRKANELTKGSLKGLLNKYLWMTKEDMQAAIKDPALPMIEVMIASIVYKAAALGDDKRLEFLLTRVVGKVKEEIEISTYVQRLQSLSEAEIIELGREAVKFIEGGTGGE